MTNAKSTPKNNLFQLVENGLVHTKWLTKEEADEMLNRHQRFFPECEWYVEHQNERSSLKSRFFKK